MGVVNFYSQDATDFIAAADALRADFGTVAQFGVPTTPQWPPGTAINPDTGAPYDATVVQVNPEFVLTPITVLLIELHRPRPDKGWSESGLREGMDIALDVAAADYDAVVSQATSFEVMGKSYNVEEGKPFSIANQTYRWLVYGSER